MNNPPTSPEEVRAGLQAAAEKEAQGAAETVLMEFFFTENLIVQTGVPSMSLPVPLDRLSPVARHLAERLDLPAIGPQPHHNRLYIRARTPVRHSLNPSGWAFEVRPYEWRRYHQGDTPSTYFEGAARQIDAWGFDPYEAGVGA